ncbi:MAG: hypothetical protein ACE5NA_01020 [Nitrospiraceae bacterium]
MRTRNRFSSILRPASRQLFVILLAVQLLAFSIAGDSADAKRRSSKRSHSSLRIIAVSPSATSYSPEKGPLDLAIEVQLPNNLYGDTILEVSSLITSPSRTALKFLSSRQALTAPSPDKSAPADQTTDTDPRVHIILTWDGTDQSNQRAKSGHYRYEVRAKLLRIGYNGPRTALAARPVRGTIEVVAEQTPASPDPSESE